MLRNKRLGHISHERLQKAYKDVCFHLSLIILGGVECANRKLTKSKRKGSIHNQNLLGIIHTDILNGLYFSNPY